MSSSFFSFIHHHTFYQCESYRSQRQIMIDISKYNSISHSYLTKWIFGSWTGGNLIGHLDRQNATLMTASLIIIFILKFFIIPVIERKLCERRVVASLDRCAPVQRRHCLRHAMATIL